MMSAPGWIVGSSAANGITVEHHVGPEAAIASTRSRHLGGRWSHPLERRGQPGMSNSGPSEKVDPEVTDVSPEVLTAINVGGVVGSDDAGDRGVESVRGAGGLVLLAEDLAEHVTDSEPPPNGSPSRLELITAASGTVRICSRRPEALTVDHQIGLGGDDQLSSDRGKRDVRIDRRVGKPGRHQPRRLPTAAHPSRTAAEGGCQRRPTAAARRSRACQIVSPGGAVGSGVCGTCDGQR